jgi:hypothetical protein
MSILSSRAQHALLARRSVFGLLLQAESAAASLAPHRDQSNWNLALCRMHAAA